MDADEFAALFATHRGELRVHCYRMLGSYDEAEDLVQETFLRSWKGIETFAGRSTLRAWLYRIATNACLDTLHGKARRVLPHDVDDSAEPLWLQPFPDGPDTAAVDRETLELAFLAAIQHLPPWQRAVLILRDVLGWRAAETADLLDHSVPSVHSALRRARVTMREHLPERRLDWARPSEPTDHEKAVLRRYMTAMERADLTAMATLLAEDVRTTMPPYREWFQGRTAVIDALTTTWNPRSPLYVGRFHPLATSANRQPAVAAYVCRDDETRHAFAISVLRIEGDHIAEATAFHDTSVFARFDLPMSFPASHRLSR